MSSPYGSAYNHSWRNHTNSSWEPRPPQYAPPEPPFYTSTPQSPQPPQSIPPFEQAILDLTRIVDDFVEENKEINAHSIVTMEDNLNKKIDGLKDDFEHKWDNLQDSIENLINQQQCPPKEECQSDIMAEEQCEQQPHQELIEDFIELSEGLAESLDMCDVVFPRENQEEIITLLTEEGNETKAVEVPKNNVLQPIPTELNPTATAQDTKCLLPVAPSTDQVYILPPPATQSTPKTPTTKATPSLPILQNLKKLVVIAHIVATTSKKLAAAHIVWHSGWFGCRFGFGASEPRHF